MSNKCPKCGSIRIIKASEDVSICLACESLLNMINGKSKPTLFDHITASEEALAEKLVYVTYHELPFDRYVETWHSTLSTLELKTEAEAIAATIEKLKEVTDE